MRPKSISKILSLNDTGETGGHQAGILIPKGGDILQFFPELDADEKNPRISLYFIDEANQRWKFNFIYYNNKFFGGTRNEYRLTGMTEYIRHTFLSFAQVFQSRRAKVQLLINQEAVSISSWENWPTRWDHIALRISRSPISEGAINYEEVILDWGLSMMAMVLSLANIVPLENDDQDTLSPKMEGNVRQCYVTKYERSPVNRMLCLAIKGYNCSVCGMNFEEVYGEIGTGFIHVHHSVPVSKMGPDYIVNPEKELFPVCPNCHAMLHRCDPPMSIDELKKVINSQHTEETDRLVLT